MFYAAIALVIMVWLWPMTRDLRTLERSTVRFGDRNWSFDASHRERARRCIRSPQAFRRMAARIDGLIGSHKDMSNALSHEIKTPLARMLLRDRAGARRRGSARRCCGTSTT